MIQEFHVPAYEEMWRIVRKTEALDRKTIRFTLSEPSAEFLERTLFTSFVQQKQWQPVVDSSRDSDNPLAELEAVRRGPFQGWVRMPGGIGNLWSFLNLEPNRQAK